MHQTCTKNTSKYIKYAWNMDQKCINNASKLASQVQQKCIKDTSRNQQKMHQTCIKNMSKYIKHASNILSKIHNNTQKPKLSAMGDFLNGFQKVTYKNIKHMFKNTSNIHQQIRKTIIQKIHLKYIKTTSTHT